MGAFTAADAAGVGSAPAKPPADPAEVGLENWRVAALVIMRSGAASSGAALAGAGESLGEEPNAEMRDSQPGPADLPAAGRPAYCKTSITSAMIAATAAAACRRLSSSTPEG